MSECHCQIYEISPWLYKAPRQGDFFLMDVVARSNLPHRHIEIFNRMRLNLHLITASDIVVADSRKTILPNIFNRKNYRDSKLNWPQVQNLPQQWNNIYVQVLREVIQPKLNNTPLGKWEYEGHQIWNYFCDDNDVMYHRLVVTNWDTYTPADVVCRRGLRIIGD